MLRTGKGDTVMANLKKLHKLVLEHLDAEEKVLHSVLGAYETEVMGTSTVRNGALFATNNRLMFYAKKMFGFDMEIFPYENISSIEIGKGLMGYKISFYASGNKVKVKWINKGDVKALVEYVKTRIGKNAASSIATGMTVSEDIPTQIAKLAQLMQQGILSQDEYETKKRQLLARM